MNCSLNSENLLNLAMVSSAEEYAKTNLPDEIQAIEGSGRRDELAMLNIFEKAIIYKYSTNGFSELNERLRESEGNHNSEFGELLDSALAKLPNYVGLIYRTADLTKAELQLYKNSLKKKKAVTEYCFISATKSRTFAMYLKLNTLFMIMSKTGKEIEKIAKFGVFEPPNESEVLFRYKQQFKVLDITKEGSRTLIKMEEV